LSEDEDTTHMMDTGPTLEAMVAFARALENEGIDLRGVEVRLPEGDWRRLRAAADRDTAALRLTHDPIAETVEAGLRDRPLNILGVRYLIRYD
jgi:hypothetical protein